MFTKVLMVMFIFTLSFTSSLYASSVYHNTAIVIVKNGKMGEYLAAATKAQIIEKTRKEPGNIAYSFRVETGALDTVIFTEIWKDVDALNAHLGTAHMGEFFKMISTDLSKYVPLPDTDNVVVLVPNDELKRTGKYTIEKLILDGN